MKKRGKNRLFLNKKADANEIYHILIQILIAITAYWILQSYIDSVAKDTLFEKLYLSKDLASLVNIIYGSPGEVNYVYSNDRAELNRFKFGFDGQMIKVEETDSKGKLAAEQPYAEDLALPYSGQKLPNVQKMTFSRTKGSFEITQNEK
ncbi:MAG: hypothetical protein Q8R04_06990 [Nanoarchaeota archaeon]|nr:hypothetical protein [Nanoarchaeota archaeon]